MSNAMSRAGRSAVAATLSLSLAACATNPLRLDYGGEVADRGKLAAAASAAFLDRVEEARVEANLALIESDPNCAPLLAHVRLRPDLAAATASPEPARGWLCTREAVAGRTSPLSLAPMGDEFEPTLQAISAVGAYSEAIAGILLAEGGDPAAEFTATLALLGAAGALFDAAGGGPGAPPDLLSPDDPRPQAVAGFLAFVADLADEQSRVDQLRQLAASEQGSAELVANLQAHLRQWNGERIANMDLHDVVATAMMGQLLQRDPAPVAEERRLMAERYYQRDADRREARLAFAALDGMLGALAAADRDLRRTLAENPDLSPAERAQLARVFRGRVTDAFGTLTALLTAF